MDCNDALTENEQTTTMHNDEESFHEQILGELYERVPSRRLTEEDRIVIFSDLHMGNGSRLDDFLLNSDLFTTVLQQYYVPRSFHLILNGDVEELQRFSMRDIIRRWRVVYDGFAEVSRNGGITRIVGNHDLDLLSGGLAPHGRIPRGCEGCPETFADAIHEGLRLENDHGTIFIFHGHQTSRRYVHYNNVVRIVLRYLANPLHIRNYTVAASSRKRFKTERRVYEFASRRKLLAIIGHTHRPLFESMSKTDTIQFEIERLCRKYPKSKKQEKIQARIESLKTELLEIQNERDRHNHEESLYQEHLLVPSVFNSGCVLGKRGMTNLEIERGKLRLVYWYDERRKQKHMLYRGRDAENLAGTDYKRVVIKEDSLDYIFSRIELLA